jgi:hypothetical protein
MKCIAKVANIVKVSEKTKRKAAEIMSNVMKEEISAGKDPRTGSICTLLIKY